MHTTRRRVADTATNDHEIQTREAASTKGATKGQNSHTAKKIVAVILLLFVGLSFLLITGGDHHSRGYNPRNKAWWKTAVMYQVYPRAFQDSNGDGVGDIRGIESRLDYIVSLGVTAVGISPVYQSPMIDFGFDISDFRKVDPVFGTMEDFDRLLEAVHQKGLYLIMDFVPNHTSDLHWWFQESKRSKDNPYSDFYIWCDGKTLDNGTRVPPNNWISHFGGSAWEWSYERQQFYYHQYAKEQPDLNYRNGKVRKETEDTLKFWMRKGLDGFRMDAVDHLFEREHLLDEPRSYKDGIPETNPEYLIHTHTKHQHEIVPLLKSWRAMMDEFERNTGKHIYIMMHNYDSSPDLRRWRDYYEAGPDHPVSLVLMSAFPEPIIGSCRSSSDSENGVFSCDGACIGTAVSKVMRNLPAGKWPSWVVGNHGIARMSCRVGLDRVDVINMLLLLLPGTCNTYYGEELGMLEVAVTKERVRDPRSVNRGGLEGDVTKYSREPVRSPMQWRTEVNAGYSNATAQQIWPPVHPAYAERNVELQDRDVNSTLNKYRQLVRLRSKPAFKDLGLVQVAATKEIFAFVRHADIEGPSKYLVILNVGNATVTMDYTTRRDDISAYVTWSTQSNAEILWPETGRIVFDTLGTSVHEIVHLHRVTTKRSQGIVVEFS